MSKKWFSDIQLCPTWEVTSGLNDAEGSQLSSATKVTGRRVYLLQVEEKQPCPHKV